MLRARVVVGHCLGMPVRIRLIIAAFVAALCALYVTLTPHFFPTYVSDFDHLWLAARAWRQGCDPYRVVLEHHQSQGMGFGLVYPFTTVVMALPLSYLSLETARAVVAVVISFPFAFLVLSRGWWLFPVLLSAPFRSSISALQIAPLAVCAMVWPWFGAVAAWKPNVGLGAWAGVSDKRKALLFLIPPTIIAALSFILWPTWLPAWFAGVRTGSANQAMVTVPLGAVLLLAATKWRRPEARWITMMSVLPVNPKVYDSLPLMFFLPQSFRQALLFAIWTHLVELGAYAVAQRGGSSFDARSVYHARALLWFLYLPALALILSRRNARPTE